MKSCDSLTSGLFWVWAKLGSWNIILLWVRKTAIVTSRLCCFDRIVTKMQFFLSHISWAFPTKFSEVLIWSKNLTRVLQKIIFFANIPMFTQFLGPLGWNCVHEIPLLSERILTVFVVGVYLNKTVLNLEETRLALLSENVFISAEKYVFYTAAFCSSLGSSRISKQT